MASSTTTSSISHNHPDSALLRAREGFSMVANGGLGPDQDDDDLPPTPENSEAASAVAAYAAQYAPHAKRSLSGIALRSFLLGNVLITSAILSFYLLVEAETAIWRAPAFLAFVALFHFLEFWTTAAYNTLEASTSSFLLSSNGIAYNLAMALAVSECVATNLFFPTRHLLPAPVTRALLALGLFLTISCQIIRTLAIVTAGQSFNHIVQHKKKDSHKLIDHGIYAYLRHPSYFGYFWWGIGTQLMLGNALGLVVYAGALWIFFARRIPGEENGLVSFFGDDYLQYRKKAVVGIPFIR